MARMLLSELQPTMRDIEIRVPLPEFAAVLRAECPARLKGAERSGSRAFISTFRRGRSTRTIVTGTAGACAHSSRRYASKPPNAGAW